MLFIGVRDDGAMMGIEQDCAALKGNKDSFFSSNQCNQQLSRQRV